MANLVGYDRKDSLLVDPFFSDVNAQLSWGALVRPLIYKEQY